MNKKSETQLTIGTIVIYILALGFLVVVFYLLFINRTIFQRLAALVGGVI